MVVRCSVGAWNLNQGSLQERLVLLIMEPFLQPLVPHSVTRVGLTYCKYQLLDRPGSSLYTLNQLNNFCQKVNFFSGLTVSTDHFGEHQQHLNKMQFLYLRQYISLLIGSHFSQK